MSPRARHFGRGMSGQHKDAGTDDAADSQRNEIERRFFAAGESRRRRRPRSLPGAVLQSTSAQRCLPIDPRLQQIGRRPDECAVKSARVAQVPFTGGASFAQRQGAGDLIALPG